MAPVDRGPAVPLDPDAPSEGGRPLHFRAGSVLLVLAGGCAGTLSRYGLSLALPTQAGRWPWGTFVANLIGCFVLGALLEALARAGPDDGWRRRLRLLLGTGFCGGLTTYSTYAVEIDLLVRDHAAGVAVTYLAVSLVAGLCATTLGVAAAARVRLESNGHLP